MTAPRPRGLSPELEARYVPPGRRSLVLDPWTAAEVREMRGEGGACLHDVIADGTYAAACMERSRTGRPLPAHVSGLLRWARVRYVLAARRVKSLWEARGGEAMLRRLVQEGARVDRLRAAADANPPATPRAPMPTRPRRDRSGDRPDADGSLWGLFDRAAAARGAPRAPAGSRQGGQHNIHLTETQTRIDTSQSASGGQKGGSVGSTEAGPSRVITTAMGQGHAAEPTLPTVHDDDGDTER